MKEQQNGADYLFEDGTGSFPGHIWSEKATAYGHLKVGDWVRAFGQLKVVQGSTRYLAINHLIKIDGDNFDLVTHHLLQAIHSNLQTNRKPAKPSPADAGQTLDASNNGLSPIQNAILGEYQKASSLEIGLHVNSVIQALRSRYSDYDIRETITWLMNEGYLYQTIDNQHAKASMY